MTQLYGFELVKETNIPEINSNVRVFRHIKTGAEVLSLENNDENKCFGITFTTPPPDDTGLPHIMEHSVLCGSRKYPSKDPFFELVKGSLATFINAMTFSDKTVYPVASQNTKDFYNLVDVYLDAVFHPNITPDTLKQEGWHYDLESPEGEMIYKGVVFNEMKGFYSSPDQVLYLETGTSLFPDNLYGANSGGNPQVIPNLTFEQFKAFHDTYYHPSNARIYFYGDDNPEERLKLISGYLSEFERKNLPNPFTPQSEFSEPRRVTIPYDAGEEAENKALVTVNWALPDSLDVERTMSFQMLYQILLGSPASPLYKALLDSELGEDTAGLGLDTDAAQMIFSTGMRGVALEDAGKVEETILQTLEQLTKEGIDPLEIEAALNTFEFSLREYNTGQFPRGLAMMFSSLSTWLYGGDPLAPLSYESTLTSLKEKLAGDNRYFEKMIETYLLNNHHRSTILLEPDSTYRQRIEAQERARLDAVRAKMTDEEIQAIVADTHRLREQQEAPDSPEAIAKLPFLKLSDLERESRHLPIEVSQNNGATVVYHDIFSNGITYLDLGFNLQTIPQDLIPYLGLFGTVLLEMGTEKEDFVRLTQRIGSKTGGIDTATIATEKYDRSGSALWMFIRAKGTQHQNDDVLAILQDILLTLKLDDKERFKQIVLTEKSSMEARLVPAGHMMVGSRLSAHFTLSGWVREQMGGVSYLFFLRDLANQIENNWEGVLAKLESLKKHLINRDTMICNVTLDTPNWEKLQPKLDAFIRAMPSNGTNKATWTPTHPTQHEGLSIPAQVNYVGKAGNLYEAGFELHGAMYVAINYMRIDYLLNRIRIQGGAYGAFANFDPNSGVFGYGSYRDPNLLRTLDVYDGTADFLRSQPLSDDELTKNIIGVIGDFDPYLLPDAKGYVSLNRYLVNISDEQRQKTRDQVLSTTNADLKKVADALDAVKNGHIVVLGSKDAIEKANAERGNFLKVTPLL